MREYDEKCCCIKCGKQLPYYNHEYTHYHDLAAETDVVKRVDRKYAKEVGHGDFYCNECYEKIPDSSITSIIESAIKFINEDVPKAITEVNCAFQDKLNNIKKLHDYVQKGIDFLLDNHKLSDLSNEELSYILQYCYLYQPVHQDIKPGFCSFKLATEVREMLKIR
jgi:hypothetical protein